MIRIATSYKKAYSGLSASTWLLSIVMLINRAGTMVMPFMTLYMTEKQGVSISKAGFVMTLFGAGSICGGIIGGRLTDRFNFYFIQMFALIGGGVLFFILGQLNDYTSICLFAFLLSLVNESFRPANAAAVAHYSKTENRTRSYSLNRLAINLGWAVGGALGGFIASKSYHLLFIIDGATNLLAAVFLWIFLAPSKNKATTTGYEPKPIIKRSAYKDKQYIGFIFLTAIFAYCFFQLFTTLPVYFKQDLHLAETYIGLLMAVQGLIIAFTEMVIVHNLEGKRNPLVYIIVGSVLIGLSFPVLNIFPAGKALAFASMMIITIGEMLAIPFMNTYWVSRTTVANRGQYAGLFTIAWSVAQILGPGTGAQIADNYGFSTLWWFIGIVGILAAFGYRWLLHNEIKRAQT